MAVIARICRSCLMVSGMVTTRTSTVNAMMATPIWEKQSTYNTIKVFSMGRMITSFQMRTNMEKNSTYSCLSPMGQQRSVPNCGGIPCCRPCRSTSGA